MSNKLFLSTLILLVFSFFSIQAASVVGKNDAASKVSPFSQQEAEVYEKLMVNETYMNPEIPRYKKQDATAFLEEVYSKMVMRVPPETFEEVASKGLDIPRKLQVQVLIEKVSSVLKNAELEESTGIKKDWFKLIVEDLKAFKTASVPLANAYAAANLEQYNVMRERYMAMVDVLDKHLSNPVRLSEKEYDKLHKANTLSRKKQLEMFEARYKAYLKEKAKTEKQEKNSPVKRPVQKPVQKPKQHTK